jgi:hypothetical protein
MTYAVSHYQPTNQDVLLTHLQDIVIPIPAQTPNMLLTPLNPKVSLL